MNKTLAKVKNSFQILAGLIAIFGAPYWFLIYKNDLTTYGVFGSIIFFILGIFLLFDALNILKKIERKKIVFRK